MRLTWDIFFCFIATHYLNWLLLIGVTRGGIVFVFLFEQKLITHFLLICSIFRENNKREWDWPGTFSLALGAFVNRNHQRNAYLCVCIWAKIPTFFLLCHSVLREINKSLIVTEGHFLSFLLQPLTDVFSFLLVTRDIFCS